MSSKKINTYQVITPYTLATASVRGQGDKFIFHAQKYKTLTANSLQVGNISSALCSIILGTFAAIDMGLFCMLKTCSADMMIFVCVTKNVLQYSFTLLVT
jgi:hypothetical protein